MMIGLQGLARSAKRLLSAGRDVPLVEEPKLSPVPAIDLTDAVADDAENPDSESAAAPLPPAESAEAGLSEVFVAAPVQAPPDSPAWGPYQGYIDELSRHHVAGWVHSLSDTHERVACDVVLANSGELVGCTVADQFRFGLAGMGIGDGLHAFYTPFTRSLTDEELPYLQVRARQTGHSLPISPYLIKEYNPVLFIAMDIVDNCNLRCPFCLYDYAHTRATHFMTEETIDAALRFLPYATDGNFWFSCLHEPTLHPELMRFVDKVPAEYRRKLFYTTNLAKRMPDSYFEWLANSAMHHVNVSIESLEPELYERMRKGARHRIFMENWNKLIPALRNGKTPPRLRYITMAYKSNLRELPAMVKHLIEEREAWQVELRYSFDVAHMDGDFKQSEFLEPADWLWLRDQLVDYTAEQVLLNLPPGLMLPPPGSNILPRDEAAVSAPASAAVGTAPPEEEGATTTAQPEADPESAARMAELAANARFLRGRYEFRLSWDGRLAVNRTQADFKDEGGPDAILMTLDVKDIPDAGAFLASLGR